MGSNSPPASPSDADLESQAAQGQSAAQRSIAVIGDAWTLRILRTVFRGKRRYGDFIKEFGVSRAVLTDRLNKLVAREVLLRDTREGGHPEYRLTERGLDLWPMFLAMWVWETDWGTGQDQDTWAPDVPRRQVVHTACGHTMQPQFKCLHCHQAVLPFETAAVPAVTSAGPAAPAAPASPLAITSAFRRDRQDALHITRTLQAQRLALVIGDRWNSAVVAAAFRAVRTFSGFEQALGIGPAQLSARLAELQKLGILSSRAYAGSRLEYRLTQAGIALYPVTLELVRWGNRWYWPGTPAFAVQHLLCQHPLEARWHCGHCEAELVRESVRFA
jgi:DNA-binding HxlR family transcriptional regulator